MKDLITTIGAVTILMIFVFQFCINQTIITKVIVAEKFVSSLEENQDVADIDRLKNKLSDLFSCDVSELSLEEREDVYIIKVPLRNVVACGDFLGISPEDNRATYYGVINKK